MVYLFIIIPVLLLITAIVIYNSLIRRKNDADNAFASIDAMLKMRHDLIPALVEAVRGYMKHERNLLSEITALRSGVTSGSISEEERIKAENLISRGLSDIFVAVENYPDLKASTNFLKLQGAINETEEQLAASRRAFNAAVTFYNNGIEVFPSNIIASVMRFKKRSLFEIPGTEREKPPQGIVRDNL
jgi:LemA protein